ncbi:MAG: T9SS type A sorting domain-containing protein [Chitinophagales bacterium]
MKTTLILTFFLLGFGFGHAQNIFTINITYGENEDVNRYLYGNHFSDLFDRCHCYDPWDPESPVDSIDQCMNYIASVKSRVIRYPSGGDDKWMHPMSDSVGYGYLKADIDTLLARSIIDTPTWMGRNAEINKEIILNPDDARYIDRLIDLVEYCDSINGFAPKVIFVANVTMSAWMPDIYNVWEENLATVRYLLDNGIVVGGIEMGNEHYDDVDIFETFDDYWDHIFPLLDSLHDDPMLNQIPISLVAAPEPDAAEAFGYSAPVVTRFKEWNADLRRYADSTAVNGLFDAFTVHIYQTPNMMESCYEQYEDDYYDIPADYPVPFDEADTILLPIYQCAIDSFENFTNNWLQYIFTHYTQVDDSTYRLGTGKKYWITEWGEKPATIGSSGGSGGLIGNFNNTFAESAYNMEFLLTTTKLYGAGSTPLTIQYATKHNTLSGFSYGLISQAGSLDTLATDIFFIKRASYYAFVINENLFSTSYKRVDCQPILLSGTYTPFIMGFFNYGNDLFYMPFVNSSDEDVYFDIHNMTGDTTAIGGGSLTPSSSYGSIIKYIDADQLYSHAGDNQYMHDNTYYDTLRVAPLIDMIIDDTVSTTSPDTLLVLPAYSLGWVKWQVSPNPEREVVKWPDLSITAWPNPAGSIVHFATDRIVGEDEKYVVQIYSITGAIVKVIPLTQDEVTWNCSDAAKGLYIYQVTKDRQLIGSGKVVVQ